MKLFCDKCGHIEVAHLDGYGFGDRILEGVPFEVEIVGNKLITKGVEAGSKDYFSDLNEAKWLKGANESLEQIVTDGYDSDLNCPKGGDHEVILLNDDGSDYTPPAPPKKGTKIKVFKGPTLLSDYLKTNE